MFARRLRLAAGRIWRAAIAAATHDEEGDSSSEASEPSLLRRGVVAGPAAVIYAASPSTGPIRQGEIIFSVVQHCATAESLGTDGLEIEIVTHEMAIVASQDCDLEQDFNARQAGKTEGPLLPSVLMYEATSAEILMSRITTGESLRVQITQNKNERYHVLEAVPDTQDAAAVGVSALAIDFKRYFTVPTEELYKQVSLGAKRRSVLCSPYLEHFALRAAQFQARVALPRNHSISPPKKGGRSLLS